MRRSIMALTVLAGAATFSLAAPVSAFASTGDNVTASPKVVEPGDTVTLSTSVCKLKSTNQEAHVTTDPIKGKTFTIELENGTGKFTVPNNAPNGTVEFEGTCEKSGEHLEGRFVVSNEPEGAMKTGSGGAVSGMNMAETISGGALAAAAAAGGVMALRRRRANGEA